MEIQTSRHKKGRPDENFIKRNFEDFCKEPYTDRYGPAVKRGVGIKVKFVSSLVKMFIEEFKKAMARK